MMYTIKPIEAGLVGNGSTKGRWTYLTDEGMAFPIPIITFLITAEGPDDFAAIVDTGMDQPPGGETESGLEIKGSGPEPIRRGLADEGLELSDIDTVIMTHLHIDHTANVGLFPDAEFLIQRAEWEAAHDPIPHMKHRYDEEHLEELEEVDVTLIDGGFRIRPGLELILAPGHTKGMQAVLVETANEPHAIVSDLAYTKHNLEPGLSTLLNGNREKVEVTPSELEYIPPGLNVSTIDCYDSIARISERVGEDATMLPGHETEILGGIFPES